MKLKLERPLCVFDIESTGLNISKDKILELSIIKLFPNQSRKEHTWRINPEIDIPPDSSEIHGIYNKDVEDCPIFSEIVDEVLDFIEGCDLAGFNSNKFDVPLLGEEIFRANRNYDFSEIFLVDVQTIFHKMEPRTLSAAYKFYCNEELKNAHSASADTQATLDILLAQIEKYEDLPSDIQELSAFSTAKNNADLAGMLGYDKEGEIIFNFGKYKGKTAKEVFTREPGYLQWILKSDFPLVTKHILQNISLE